MKPNKSQLPVRVLKELRGVGRNEYRSCTEKRFALALLAAGITSVEMSASYWVGRSADRDGCHVNKHSIVTRGGAEINSRPILWCILDECGIRFSGCGGDKGEDSNYAQAGWLPTGDTWSFGQMNLPLMVCYFNEMKKLPV